MLIWKVKIGEENLVLLDYLQQKIVLSPTPYLRQLIRRGKVRHNGTIATATQVIRCGDAIAVPESRRLLDFLELEKTRPIILFESDHILIAHKPPGLATHSGKGHEQDNLLARVEAKMRAENKMFKIAAIHRLDLPTSGPVIFGKGQKAISTLGCLMQERQIGKRYLAVVRAGLPEQGRLAGPIPGKGKLKQAETDFAILEQQHDLTLLELSLKTGRQHQIRKQLADQGHPIAGDSRYRGATLPGLNQLFLHCHHLIFIDPFTLKEIEINDPLPAPLAQFLASKKFTCGKR